MPVSLTRVLVLLLAFRAIVAPWTYRSVSGNTLPLQLHHQGQGSQPVHRHYTLVMSLRWWPPQRLQRFSRSSKLLRLFRGKSEVAPDEEGRLQALVALWTSLRRPSRQSIPCLALACTASRLSTFLRC